MTKENAPEIHEQFVLFDEQNQTVSPEASLSGVAAANLGGIAVVAESVDTQESKTNEVAVLEAKIEVLDFFGRENKSQRNIWAKSRQVDAFQRSRMTGDPRYFAAQESLTESIVSKARLEQLGKQSFAKALGIEVEVKDDPQAKKPEKRYIVTAKDPAEERKLAVKYQKLRGKFATPDNNDARKKRLEALKTELKVAKGAA